MRSVLLILYFFFQIVSLQAQSVKLGVNVGHRGKIMRFAQTTSGSYLISVGGNEVKLIDSKTFKVVRSVQQAGVLDAVMTNDGEKLFAANEGFVVYQGDNWKDRKILVPGLLTLVERVCLSEDERFVACLQGKAISVFDTKSLEKVAHIFCENAMGLYMTIDKRISFIENTDLLLLNNGNQEFIFNWKKGEELLNAIELTVDTVHDHIYFRPYVRKSNNQDFEDHYFRYTYNDLLKGDNPIEVRNIPRLVHSNGTLIYERNDTLICSDQGEGYKLTPSIYLEEGSLNTNLNGELLYVTGKRDKEYVLEMWSLKDRRKLWAKTSNEQFEGLFSNLNSSVIYLANQLGDTVENIFLKVNAVTGKELASTVKRSAKKYGTIITLDSMAIAPSLDGESFYKIDPNSGKVLSVVSKSAYNSAKLELFRPDIGVYFKNWNGDYFSTISVKGKSMHFIYFDRFNWVVFTDGGYFDASPGAMDLLYWVKGFEVIEFEQLKDRYWVPGLWKKIMNDEPLPTVSELNNVQLQPTLELGQITNGKLPITLTKRDGGYGKVSIWINGKEVVNDARGENMDTTKSNQTIYYTISGHPFLRDTNTIEVRASSRNGLVQGRGELIQYITEEKEAAAPNFYAIIVGVDQYANPSINLKYPSKDAKAIAKAMELGASNLFGAEKTFVSSITSDASEYPNKKNLKALFDEVSRKAKVDDVLLVYLSGHGITWGGDQGDFYFLTADATGSNKESYDDQKVRQTAAVSTGELVEWINKIPALKQVMIIDACGSGKAVDNLIVARDIEGSQIKAIDRMKDRTGMYVISGCASDAVSYEASQYGQGLLTYALLQAMKGAALREDKYVDVLTIMSHAQEKVPELAEGLGGIQEPQLLVPKGGSFDVGLLTERDKEVIPLAEPRKVFVRSMFMDTDEMEDVLNLSSKVDEAVNSLNSKGEVTTPIWIDAKEYPNACKISGGYTQTNNLISLNYKVVCGDQKTNYQIKGKSVEELVEQIIDNLKE